MRARLSRWVFAIALLAATGATAASTADFERTLREADRARSAEPARFRALLDELDTRRGEADAGQRERLRYLQAYSLLVYGRNVEGAISEAVSLFGTTRSTDLKFRAGSLIVNSHAVTRNFGEGLRYLDQTLPLRFRVVDKDIRHDGINTAAILYNQLGQYRLGLHHAEETLADAPNARARCFASHLRIEAQYHLGTLPVGDAPIQSVIAQCARISEVITTNFVRATLARRWADDGRVGEAIALLQAHLAEVERTGYSRMIGEMHSLLGELLLKQGDVQGAQQHAQAAVAQSAGIASSLPLVMAYRTLYEIAERRRDPVGALSYYRSYAEADKAYLNDVKARELAYQIARQENAQKTQQIELLDRQNQVLMLQQRIDKQDAANDQLTIALLLLAVGSVGFWAYRTKRVQLSLRRMADTDMLTGVSNRRHFSHGASHTLARCLRDGEPAALIMFDLDHFKSINDRFGHDTGDWVLRQVASTCLQFRRSVDRFGRLGGEEFAFLLHGCDKAAAVRLAEDCRMRLAQIDTRATGHVFRISASFGVSASAESGHELASLLTHADRMLYRAKGEGRNRVAAYSPAHDDVRAAAVPATLQVVEDGDVARADEAPQAAAARHPGRTLTLVDTSSDRVGTSG